MFKHGLATTVVAAFSFASSAALAEELGSGTLTPDNPVLTIESGPHNTSNPSAQVEQTCNEQLVCDFFDLTVDVSEAWLLANPNARLRVTGGWPDPSSDAGGPSATDFDFYLRSATGSEVAGTTGATSANPEMMQVVPTPGSTDYRVVIVPFLVAGQTATVRMELDPGSSPSGGGASVTKGGPAMAIYRPNNGMAGFDTPPLPDSAWYARFIDPAGTVRGVRMVTDALGQVAFQSYLVSEDNDGERLGQFADGTPTPAEPESNYSDDGTITLVIDAQNIGIPDGGLLSDFLVGSFKGVTTPVASLSLNGDAMPNGNAAGSGSDYEVPTRNSCAPNAATLAALAASPVTGEAPLSVTLDATGSSDADGSIVSYAFTPGDGSPTVTNTTGTLTHSYDVGTWQAEVVVTDDLGAVSTNPAVAQITVSDGTTGGNTAGPGSTIDAVLAVSGDGSEADGEAVNGDAETVFTFDASDSGDTDAVGSDLRYTFVFADEASEEEFAPATSDPIATHRYSAAGTYTAYVIVSDAFGNSDTSNSVTITTTITITVEGDNGTVAQLTVDETSGAAPLRVAFDGSRSFTSDGKTITEYCFDFDDEGEVQCGVDPTAVYVYTRPGSYEPSLTVTASDESTATAKATVSVGGTGSNPSTPSQPAASTGGGSGALGGLLLLPLLGFGLARRRG